MKRISKHTAVGFVPCSAEYVNTIYVRTLSGAIAFFDIYRSGRYFYCSLMNRGGALLIVRTIRISSDVLGDMAYAAGLR